jgi:uncharacterized membrane protein YhaH (DUF805 family)
MNIIERISSSFSDLTSFSTKARRIEFFTAQLVIITISIIFYLICIEILTSIEAPFVTYLIAKGLSYLIFGYFQIANVCRRLNDIKKEKLLFLLIFIPFINFIFLAYLLFYPSNNSLSKDFSKTKSEETIQDLKINK